VLEEEERAIVDPRQPSAESAGKAELAALVLDDLLDLLPFDPERRIREQVVVPLALEGVLAEAVAEHEVRGALAFHHHVGPAEGVRLGVELLAVSDQLGSRVQLAQVGLADRDHASGAAGRVEHGSDGAGRSQDVVVLDEEEIDHQADDFAWREVLAGGLVG